MTAADFVVSDIRKSIDGRPVLDGIGLSVRRGEIVALLGPTGSGKSTCFKIMMGILKPDGGAVSLFGRDVTALGVDGRARLGLGYVPQAPELFERLSVRDNLFIALDARVGRSREAAALLDNLMTSYGLDEVSNRPVSILSGGQRRLVEIAYAVCTVPKFLLLDEPFSGLDPIVVERIARQVRSLARTGIGIVITDHKARLALDLASRALVICNGQVIADGLSCDVARNPRVRKVFLGEEEDGGRDAAAAAPIPEAAIEPSPFLDVR